jgi:nitrate reductase NapE component
LRCTEKSEVNPIAQLKGRLCTIKGFILLAAIILSYLANAQTDQLYYTTGENLAQKTSKYLFLKVKANKKEALVGECISAWYYLYVAVDIQGKLTKSPSFTGFASYDVESGNTDAYDIEKINGVPFRVYLVKQVQLYGLQPGIQRLEPVELEASIRYRKMPEKINDVSPYSGAADSVFNYTLTSTPFEINIKKLPPISSGSFLGAVGDFNFSATATSNIIEAGKADTLQWVISGNGNWHEILFPSIKWPHGAEVYEPFSTELLDNYAVPVKGSRTMAYPVVFNKKGSYLIAPVAFTFFNPTLGQYKTIQTDTIRITVKEARDAAIIPEKQINPTILFSRYAIIIFPIVAVTLLGLLFFMRRKKGPTENQGVNR